MEKLTIFSSDAFQNPTNCLYPHEVEGTDIESLKKAFSHDFVLAKYKNDYRSKETFCYSNIVGEDSDNDHSENPADWLTEVKMERIFKDVSYIAQRSKSFGVAKGKYGPRERHHVMFKTSKIHSAEEYARLKKRIQHHFPFFDKNAMDAARLFFGTENPEIIVHEGTKTIEELLDELDQAEAEELFDEYDEEITEGSRNTTLNRYAASVLIRYGDTDKARTLYAEKASKCNPPLPENEVKNAWNSAMRFYEVKKESPNYIPPEVYNSKSPSLKPDDLTDVGEAEILAREYKNVLRYSPATDFLCYNGAFWEESKEMAHAIVHKLTKHQLREARNFKHEIDTQLEDTGTNEILAEHTEKKALQKFDDAQVELYKQSEQAMKYLLFVLGRRKSSNVVSTLKEAKPMLVIDPLTLDANEFLLNIPDGTIDLRTGKQKPHDSNDFITKVTTVSPDTKGMDIWLDALKTFFCDDEELISYVQQVVGLAVIGKVYVETLIIAHGEGRNGKSTFWNTISRVLGTYSGNISADTLTANCRRNVKPELAEAKGKRLLIAAELEEGTRLSTSIIKQLCSTDKVYGEKKFKSPLSFMPTHTLVLYTNHLPKVGASDPGTWRRLMVIPFNAVIEGNGDIKNYADYLYQHCGGAILTWIVEGAKTVIANDYKPTMPQAVEKAIAEYRESNDWLEHFFSERCEVGDSYKERSGDLYSAYRSFCASIGEYTRSTTDFYAALKMEGFSRKKERSGSFIQGIKLKTSSDDFLK